MEAWGRKVFLFPELGNASGREDLKDEEIEALGSLIRGEAERNLMGLEFMVPQKMNPKKLERYKLKKEILGSTVVLGTGADRNVRPYPTSYQKSKQTKSVREFCTGGFAPYRPPVPDLPT
jgi:hypothetical protein